MSSPAPREPLIDDVDSLIGLVFLLLLAALVALGAWAVVVYEVPEPPQLSAAVEEAPFELAGASIELEASTCTLIQTFGGFGEAGGSRAGVVCVGRDSGEIVEVCSVWHPARPKAPVEESAP